MGKLFCKIDEFPPFKIIDGEKYAKCRFCPSTGEGVIYLKPQQMGGHTSKKHHKMSESFKKRQEGTRRNKYKKKRHDYCKKYFESFSKYCNIHPTTFKEVSTEAV